MYYLIAYDITSARTRRIAVKLCKQAGLRRMQKSVFTGDGLPEKIGALEETLRPLLGKDDRLCIMPLDARNWKSLQLHGSGPTKTALAPDLSGARYY
ncbi:MAG: CRISPR-associated endonuclease Cas2 [Saprospiraceae bacterium]|nr:CRISPR-associated endonuclease Cas2 [Saprospiraceae bacterium]